VTDDELIAKVQAGDATAEREFYDRHVERVYRLIHRMSGRDDLAQDWTQETFVRAFQRIAQFRGDSSLATWLHAIAVSVTLNALRTTKRRDARAVDIEAADAVHTHDNRAEPDLKERLQAAIHALPSGYRTVFVMHDVEGFTHEEIGAALGVATGTSKAQLFRAREKLRIALAPFARPELA
jgi:RNA polymerase sigma-70 factor (ECF subfamily)